MQNRSCRAGFPILFHFEIQLKIIFLEHTYLKAAAIIRQILLNRHDELLTLQQVAVTESETDLSNSIFYSDDDISRQFP